MISAGQGLTDLVGGIDKPQEVLGKTDSEIAHEVFNLRRQTTINFKVTTPDDMLELIFEYNNFRNSQTGLG